MSIILIEVPPYISVSTNNLFSLSAVVFCRTELKTPRGAMKTYWTNDHLASDQGELGVDIGVRTVLLI